MSKTGKNYVFWIPVQKLTRFSYHLTTQYYWRQTNLEKHLSGEFKIKVTQLD